MISPSDSVMTIPLTQGRVALIDAADLPLVESYKWRSPSWHGYSLAPE
jgi:hypothetical protein